MNILNRQPNSTLSKTPEANFTLQQAPVPPPCSLCRLNFPVLLLSSFSIPFLTSSSRWMYLCKSEIGTKDTLFGSFLVGDRPLISRSPLTSHLLDFPHLAAWTWQVGDLSVAVSTKYSAFRSVFFSFFILLPSAYLPCDPSLPICFSSSVSVFLPLSEVFDPWEPEDSLQPLGPWVNDGPTNTPFCTLIQGHGHNPLKTLFFERIAQSGSLVNSS